MTKHDAKVIVEDAVRDIQMCNQSSLVVPVRRPTLDAILGCRGEPWFTQHNAMLYLDNKLIRFVLSTEGSAAA